MNEKKYSENKMVSLIQAFQRKVCINESQHYETKSIPINIENYHYFD